MNIFPSVEKWGWGGGCRRCGCSADDKMVHRLWSKPRRSTSSTCRDLLAVRTFVFQLISTIRNKTVSLFTDSKNTEIILTKGSTNIPLHNLALSIPTSDLGRKFYRINAKMDSTQRKFNSSQYTEKTTVPFPFKLNGI